MRKPQNHVAVFRSDETLKEGKELIDNIRKEYADININDRSLVWNSDLVEALELANLLDQAVLTMHAAKIERKVAVHILERIFLIATTMSG